MKPYSIDFRQKIIEVYEQEDIAIRKLAQSFPVAKRIILSKKTLHAAEKESDQGEPASQAGRLQKKRVEFWLKIRDIPVEDLIFRDESGVNLALVRL